MWQRTNLPENEEERAFLRQYVIDNFDRALKTQRVVLFILGTMIPFVLALIGWLLVAGGAPGFVGLLLLTIGLGLSVFFHGLSAGLEGETGRRQIRAQLIKEAQLKQRTGEFLADELFAETEKRKREEFVGISDDGELVTDEEIGAKRHADSM